jgi:hypothetical protein
MDLFYRRGKKRKNQLQGLWLSSDKRLFCSFPGERFIA